jgi:hypothetical protein
MRKPWIIYRWVRRLLRRRWAAPATHAISSIDPGEFSDLLCSGRKDDLKLLARKLSEQMSPSRRALDLRNSRRAAASRNTRMSK